VLRPNALGGPFLLGMFVPRARGRTAMIATIIGLLSSIALGYLEQIGALLTRTGLITGSWPELSFTWILPASLLIGLILAPTDRSPRRPLEDLTGCDPISCHVASAK